MKSKLLLLSIAACTLLTGCPEDQPLMPMNQGTGAENRFIVERVGVFKDDLAYHDKRGIYILTDKKTDKKYIGVSGIGISELGSHTDDDNTIKDER